MRLNLVTILPEYFDSPLRFGLMGKAVQSGVVQVRVVNPRDFATDRHRSVDARPYGGGPGMVMLLEPLVAALESLKSAGDGGDGQSPGQAPGRVLVMSPKGRRFTQAYARELAAERELTIVCGRFEGVDDRLGRLVPVEEVSVGDFVLNGGEAGAACVVEAVSRLLPGFMGHADSGEEESFSAGLLEYPHYTRPEVYQGLGVPEVLVSGDHAKVAAWRRAQSVVATFERRPDLLAEAELTPQDMAALQGLERPWLGRNVYVILLHYPVLGKDGRISTVSLTSLDLHDISRVSRSYRLGGFFAATPLADQRELAGRILGHWLDGPGLGANPVRAEALRSARVRESLDEVLAEIALERGLEPVVVATSARLPDQGGRKGRSRTRKTAHCGAQLTPGRVRDLLSRHPVALVFGTGHGLAPEVLERADGVLRPIRYLGDYNHLPVRSAVSVTVDRILGDLL